MMNNLQNFDPKTPAPTGSVPDAIALREIICGSTANNCADAFGSHLKAIVLTGSMARDEASFVHKGEFWDLLGDAEFMVVFEERSNLPPGKLISDVRRQIEETLKLNGIKCTVDLGVVDRSYFRRLPPHIFSYELRHCGRVIFGDNQILQSIPDFSPSAISLEDGWRLLCNRLLEVLECAPELSNAEGMPSAKLQYKILKLYLDMATSLLVFLGAYVPTYRERQKVLRQLAADHVGHQTQYPFELERFADLIDCCTDHKLIHDVSHYGIDLSWQTAVQTAHSLWYWELANLVKEEKPISDRELFRKWMSKQHFRSKIRGWAYLLRARHWRGNYKDWANWLKLCWRASPRYWIYYVANLLLFQQASGRLSSKPLDDNSDLPSLIRCLPVNGTKGNGVGHTSWESAAAVTVWNYREFLVGTRA